MTDLMFPPIIWFPLLLGSFLQGGDLETALQRGDWAFAQFKNREALAEYERAYALKPDNYQTQWKLARSHIDVGQEETKSDRKQHFLEAEQLARQCVRAFPDGVECHFYLAVVLGRLALVEGGKKKVELSKEIRRESERTLELDPQHAGAMHVMGRWHYELANLSWYQRAVAKMMYGGIPKGASLKDARLWFEKAVEIDPDTPAHHLWLGKTLLELKDYTLARGHFEMCVKLSPVLWDDPRQQAEARAHLERIRLRR